MAIIVRHRTLSQKTQSAIAGIISKNEWNDTHQVESIDEVGNINWNTASGHNHDGLGSRYGSKTYQLNDSYTGTTTFRNASKYPQANEIPILDGNGYMNIRRVGSTQYSKLIFTDGVTPNAEFGHDFTNGWSYITNLTGLNYIYLLSTGGITIKPKTSSPLTVTIDNVHLKNIVATDNSEVRMNFKDSAGSISGYIGYKYHTTDATNVLRIKNTKGVGYESIISLDGGGNVILNSNGLSGKVYYTHNEATPTSNDEVATKYDITRGLLKYTTSDSYIVPSGVTDLFVYAAGGGGGGQGGNGSPTTTSWYGGYPGGDGGKIYGFYIPVVENDVISFVIGTGGTKGLGNGYANGFVGSNGTSTIISKNGTVLITCGGGIGGTVTSGIGLCGTVTTISRTLFPASIIWKETSILSGIATGTSPSGAVGGDGGYGSPAPNATNATNATDGYGGGGAGGGILVDGSNHGSGYNGGDGGDGYVILSSPVPLT